MSTAVNGVFKGGGAKGIAYAGAIQVCQQTGLEFQAVAGSSAGAITAAALAAGYSGEEIEQKMPEALATIGSWKTAFFVVWRRSLLRSDRLREWIHELLLERVDPSNGHSVTFSDLLYRRNDGRDGVVLYVVAMDLVSGQPVVFSPHLTPDAFVADAVVASSSIPVAFSPKRYRVGDETRRFIDGGTWANYPSFVFLDKDFRSYHELDRRDSAHERDTVGFILDSDDPVAPIVPDQALPDRKLPQDRGSSARDLGIPGALTSSRILQAATILTPVGLIVIALWLLRAGLANNLALFAETPSANFIVIVAGSVLAVGSTVIAGLWLLMIRLGAEIADTGLMGARAAIGVGPSVPYWIGLETDGLRTAEQVANDEPSRHIAVRLAVPANLKTLSFHTTAELTRNAVEAGRRGALQRLSQQRSSETAVCAEASHAGEAELSGPLQATLTGGATAVLAPWALLVTAALATSWASGHRAVEATAVALLIAIGVSLFVLWRIAVGRSRRARLPHDTPDPGLSPDEQLGRLRSLGRVYFVGGVIAVGIAIAASSQLPSVPDVLNAQRFDALFVEALEDSQEIAIDLSPRSLVFADATDPLAEPVLRCVPGEPRRVNLGVVTMPLPSETCTEVFERPDLPFFCSAISPICDTPEDGQGVPLTECRDDPRVDYAQNGPFDQFGQVFEFDRREELDRPNVRFGELDEYCYLLDASGLDLTELRGEEAVQRIQVLRVRGSNRLVVAGHNGAIGVVSSVGLTIGAVLAISLVLLTGAGITRERAIRLQELHLQ